MHYTTENTLYRFINSSRQVGAGVSTFGHVCRAFTKSFNVDFSLGPLWEVKNIVLFRTRYLYSRDKIYSPKTSIGSLLLPTLQRKVIGAMITVKEVDSHSFSGATRTVLVGLACLHAPGYPRDTPD